MANQFMWYKTRLPSNIVDSMCLELEGYENSFNEGMVGDKKIDHSRRKNKTVFVGAENWIAGFCYHYITLANKNNFKYDIEGFTNDILQYSSYGQGEYYNWHVDASLGNSLVPTDNSKEDFVNFGVEKIRKISMTVQLSSPEEYSGGEFELITDDNENFFAPKEKGTIIIFDSRLRHRVKEVNSGIRKSLVGWAYGPRWK